MNTYEKNPDDENRLFYVGATRTKKIYISLNLNNLTKDLYYE